MLSNFESKKSNGIIIPNQDLKLDGSMTPNFTSKKEICARDFILSHYDSINHFCVYHKIHYNTFGKLLQNYPNYSLKRILSLYKGMNINYSKLPNIFGVTYQAICIEFQLSYINVQKFLHETESLDDLFLRAVLTTPLIPIAMQKSLLQNSELFKMKDEEQFKEAISKFSSNQAFYKQLMACYSKYHMIMGALNVYEIISWFVKDWKYEYQDAISQLPYVSKNMKDYYQKFDDLRVQAARKQMEELSLCKEDLLFYYGFYYDNYLSRCKDDEILYYYNYKKTLKI